MRILLFGKDGQVGWELLRLLGPASQVIAPGREQADLSRPAGLPELVRASNPDVIINAAAYNAVDRAESEADLAEAVNAVAPGVLAGEAARRGAVFIHYSTDYVFDGDSGRAYVETDLPNPINAYGRSKLHGEQAVQDCGGAYLILRTSWVYSLRRPCFVTQVLSWARTKEELRIAADQTGSPTWCQLIARGTAEILAGAGANAWESLVPRAGIYHLASRGAATRFAWAKAVLELDPRPAEQRVRAEAVLPARRADFPSPAARPAFTALDSARIGEVFGLAMPPWRDALQQALSSP